MCSTTRAGTGKLSIETSLWYVSHREPAQAHTKALAGWLVTASSAVVLAGKMRKRAFEAASLPRPPRFFWVEFHAQQQLLLMCVIDQRNSYDMLQEQGAGALYEA